jgi:hypothetical protein
VVLLVLAVPSGPWPGSFGVGLAQAPPFAQTAGNYLTLYYLRPLKMTHTYHFVTSRPGSPGAFFEVLLKDERGNDLKKVRFPDPEATFWVRHRQELLARGLADDQPVEPRNSEAIPAPHQKVQTVDIWDGTGEWSLIIRSVPEHLLPRDRPVMRPSSWSRLLARSYVRHLCRQSGAASGELIRHTREPILPAVLTSDDLPPASFTDLVSNFGEMSR